MPHIANTERVNTLTGMLSYCRPAGSRSERRFIREYIRPLGMETDEAGNLYKRIGRAPVLWSSHTDTVHRSGGRQHLERDGLLIKLSPRSKSNCLGADCTAGVWLMREMILAKCEGLYVFHRGEEIGGVGSSYIARNTPNLLTGITSAIAFDRRGKADIITHQAGGRCASDAFAASLAKQLGGRYAPDSGGLFTDTANYVDLIGECTNISVGYDNEHRANETLDLAHIMWLRDKLLGVDVGALAYERQPGELDDDWGNWANDPAYRSARDLFDGLAYGEEDQEPTRSKWDLYELCRYYPSEVADWLESQGINANELARAVRYRGVAL